MLISTFPQANFLNEGLAALDTSGFGLELLVHRQARDLFAIFQRAIIIQIDEIEIFWFPVIDFFDIAGSLEVGVLLVFPRRFR